jgi:aconitate hydratase
MLSASERNIAFNFYPSFIKGGSMGKNIVQKIIENHVVEGTMRPGGTIGLRIDQTLTQDATGTMAYLQFEAMQKARVATELSVSYVDHNTLQDGYENADDHHYLRSVAKKYGIVFSRPGNGICHQVHLERFGVPGKTLLGSDSHTPTGGGLGMLAIGAGGIDVAAAMAGYPFFCTLPKVVKVHLKGALRPYVSAKDVILEVLRLKTTKGNVGKVIEYSGEGVKTLSVPERSTITNMGAELGVTTSIFPSDEITRDFLRAQKREKVWMPLHADDDAEYYEVIDIDLAKLVPMTAVPHSPDNVSSVKDLEGIKVDQVCIGTCTNGSLKDILTVAKILKDKKIAPQVSLVVSAGSRQVLEMAARSGALADLVMSGARIAESVCGFCIGIGQAPGTNAVSVRTGNRNFLNRSGTKSAKVYLASPETAAACALKGELCDPRKLGKINPKIDLPKTFTVDDSMLEFPGKDGADVVVFRGPNIGNPPHLQPMKNSVSGKVLIKVGDKITTDHIMPAGKRLKYRSNIAKYAEFVFEPIDPDFHLKAKKEKGGIVIAGISYGQGSSREHAALCPRFLGVSMVIAKSFERIHRANLINFGIIPAVFKNAGDYSKINEGDVLKINGIKSALDVSGATVEVNGKAGIDVEFDFSPREIALLKAGGLLNYLKEQA